MQLSDPETIELLALVRRVQAGSREAFEMLYRQRVGRVYAICLRILADESYAEEITQEVFVRLWDRIASFRGDGPFDGWLQRLTVNTVLSEIRMQKRRRTRPVAPEDWAVFEGGQPASPDLKIDLDEAIAGLPRQARMVFVLHDIEGYKHEEVARAMGIAVGTSKTQLHRARKLLKEALLR